MGNTLIRSAESRSRRGQRSHGIGATASASRMGRPLQNAVPSLSEPVAIFGSQLAAFTL